MLPSQKYEYDRYDANENGKVSDDYDKQHILRL